MRRVAAVALACHQDANAQNPLIGALKKKQIFYHILYTLIILEKEVYHPFGKKKKENGNSLSVAAAGRQGGVLTHSAITFNTIRRERIANVALLRRQQKHVYQNNTAGSAPKTRQRLLGLLEAVAGIGCAVFVLEASVLRRVLEYNVGR